MVKGAFAASSTNLCSENRQRKRAGKNIILTQK
jgi:hypothetical protein